MALPRCIFGRGDGRLVYNAGRNVPDCPTESVMSSIRLILQRIREKFATAFQGPVVSSRHARLLMPLLKVLLLVAGVSVLGFTLFVLWPLPPQLLDRTRMVSVQLADRHGRVMRELRSREDGRSISLPDSPLPVLVTDAFIAAEDGRFGKHPGVDPIAVVRALGQNLANGRVVSGASTIAQQLARQVRPHVRTLHGKIYEMAWALRLSLYLDRDVLLREYLNRVPLGNSLLGVEAAALTYFGTPAASLSPGQAAMLAGMAASPARFDPYRHPEAARARQLRVLARMRASGMLTEEAERVAIETDVGLVSSARLFEAPHFTTWLAQNLERLGMEGAERIETTLDAGLQADVVELMQRELRGLSERRVGQAAVLVVDNRSGDVLAYVGSENFLDEAKNGQNDGVQARRQPGSALKPFAYGLALASGYTPASVLSDVETSMGTPTGTYVPHNYDRRVHGPVRVRAALANSYNIPAVKLAEALTPAKILKVMRNAGFNSLDLSAEHYGVGLVLGNGDVTLWEATRAYRGLALMGEMQPLNAIQAAYDAAGKRLPVAPEIMPKHFLPPAPVALLTDILSDELARAPAFGMDNALRLPFPVAVKTGTSRAHVDNWTLGFTKELTVGVWVGNFDGTPMEGVSGITGAGPIFKRVMIRAMAGVTPAPLVNRKRFTELDICPLSGLKRGPACPGLMHEVFLPGTAPTAFCTMHRQVSVDPRSGAMVPCGQAGSRTKTVLDLGPAWYAWARGEGLNTLPLSGSNCIPEGDSQGAATQGGGGPGAESGTAGSGETSVLARSAAARARKAQALALENGSQGSRSVFRILSPQEGDDFALEPGVPLEAQAIPFYALVPPGTTEVELRDGERIERLTPPFRTFLTPHPGIHRVELWAIGGTQPLAVARYRVQ